MSLKGALEDNVLTMVVWSEKHAAQIALRVAPELFSTRSYRKIAEAAYQHLQQFHQPPRSHIRDILEVDLRRGDEGILLERIIGDMETLQADLQPEYVLSQLDRFIELRKLASAIEAASDALNAGDVEIARAALYKADLGQKQSTGIWLHNPDQSLSFMNTREEDFFPSGVSVLDSRGVRPMRKTLFMILAPKKTGKSWWLIEMGKQALLHRKKVLHITLELSEEKTAQRYIQAVYAMSANSAATIRVPVFKRDQLGRCVSIDFDVRTPEHLRPEIRAQVAKRLEQLRNRPPIKIKEFATGTLTADQLESYLDYLARVENFQPDLLLVDYAKLMKLDKNNLRISMGTNLETLRGIAVSRNIAVVTPAQTHRAAENARVINSTMMGEDYSGAQTADIVCSLSRTKAEREAGLARVFVDASRDVEDKYLVMISQNYATGQFCIDSVYFSKYIEAEVDRISGGDGEENGE